MARQRRRTLHLMGSPFGGAKEKTRRPTPSFASSVVGTGTNLTTVPTRKPSKDRRLYAHGTTERLPLNPTTLSFASHSISVDAQHQNIAPISSTFAPCAEANHITQLPSRVEVLSHIITPYNADAFEATLDKFNLSDRYPSLPYNLRHGFPIGDMPPLSRTYTPKNHKSASDRPDIILNYCKDEVNIGRMSGPFSKDEVHEILGSHFVMSPLGLVEKAGEPGKFRIVRDFSFKNEDGYTVNNHLDSDDFPTEWGTASQVAEIVSTLPLSRRTRVLVSRKGAFVFA